MKKQTKFILLILGIIILILLLYPLINNKKPNTTTEEITKCIGEKSILYTQLGCSACETQKKLFGENYQYLNKIDCFYESAKCGGIEGTPTWKIKGKNYIGVKEIKELQELTGC